MSRALYKHAKCVRRAGAAAASHVLGGVSLGLQDLAATVEAIGADVVTQVHFARGGLDGGARSDQGIVRTVHTALGRRLLVLLNGHDFSFGFGD